jgi:hypothetical protein
MSRFESALEDNGELTPRMNFLYPTAHVIAALSVQYSILGKYTTHPDFAASSLMRARREEFAETPPPTAICLMPNFLAAFIVLRTSTSTTDA